MARHYAYRPIIGSCDKSACCLTGRSVQGHSPLYSRPYSPIINQSINQSFYSRDATLARLLTMPVSVCLSVCHKSAFYRNGWTNRAGFWTGAFFHPAYTVLQEIRLSPKIRAFPSGTLSKTPDFENLPSVYLSSKRVIDLADKGEIVINWTVVDQLSWQYLRAPTFVH